MKKYKGEKYMPLAMPNIKTLLDSLRENDWYITAFQFDFNGYSYAVVFEDLREIERGTKYFAVIWQDIMEMIRMEIEF